VSPASAEPATPAGFWHRYAAWSLDWLLLGAVLGLLLAPLCARAWSQAMALNQLLQDWVFERVVAAQGIPSPVGMAMELLVDPQLKATAEAGSAALSATLALIVLLLFGGSALYFVAFESSPWQGTPGKRLLGLRVRREDGGVAGPLRATGRHFAGALSWLLLNLGHLVAAWRRDKRALHDLLAGTRVDAAGPLPAWARAWLMAQFVLLLAALAGSFGWLAWQLWQFSQL
jgi:uncharacterized RDD family membrane protein YckC